MSKARQLFADIKRSVKVYPWTLAKLVKASGGGTVEDYLNGTKKIKKAESADSATNVEWNGVASKPATYPPATHNHTKSQISDFPESLPANGGDATTVRGFSFSNSAKPGQPTYVAGFEGGSPTSMPFYDPRNWSVRYADSAGSALRFYHCVCTESKSIVIDPVGNDYVDLPLTKKGNWYVANAVNGDVGAFGGCVKCCQYISDMKVRVVIDQLHRGNIRINYKIDWYN